MRSVPKQRFVRWIPVLAGYFLLTVIAAGPVDAQWSASGIVIDNRSPLSQDIQLVLMESNPLLTIGEVETINREVQLAALDYFLEPGLLLALMTGEEHYAGYPQARLYYYNLDNSQYASEENFPSAWFDAERVARSYSAEYGRYEDRASAIAAYFIGYRGLPQDGNIANLPQAMIDLVGMVMALEAEWSHLGERGGPQIIETDESTPDSSFERSEYDFSEIEQAYIANMMHFNQRLDDETASEIFIAIHEHAADYQAVDPRLVMALVACESNFRPEAVSRCGAQGLGQLMPFTSDRFGVDDPFDINENIRATFAYLDREIDRWASYNYPLDRILAAYNAGPGAVEQYTDAPYHGIPPYDETVNYVRNVVNNYFFMLPEEERAGKIQYQSCHYADILATIQ